MTVSQNLCHGRDFIEVAKSGPLLSLFAAANHNNNKQVFTALLDRGVYTGMALAELICFGMLTK